jgi:uncharacterized membrane protein YbhN (UPF0104 family)
MNRRRLLQSILLVAGLVAIALVIAETVEQTQEQVLPSAEALIAAGVFAVIAIVTSARAWVALFSDLVESRESHLIMRGTFYLAQLTKYLPAGGIVQTASQVGLAPAAGVPIKRAAVAFPVSVVGAVAACGTLGSGLVFDSALPGWTRALALLGVATVAFLYRGLMVWVIDLAHRVVARIPGSDQLPTQRDIIAFYLWALCTVGSLCLAYAVLLGSLDGSVNPFFIFCAFALSWLVGFLVVPIPAGVGVREAVLLFLLPGVGTAPVLAASLALRLLSIGAELLAVAVNKVVTRRHAARSMGPAAAEELTPP